MTNLPPSDPQPSRRDRDEIVAVVVAFAAIGSILAWGLSRTDQGFDLLNTPIVSGVFSPTDPAANPPTPGASAIPFVPPEGEEEEDSPRIVTEDEEGRLVDPTEPSGAIVPVPVPNRDNRADVRTSDTTDAGVVPVPAATVGAESPAPSPTGDAVEFPDVPRDYWAYPFITELSRRGILTGTEDGTFRPEQPITRAEYAALLQNMNNPERLNSIAFNDLPPDYWATPAIDNAIKTGFMRGYPGNVFQPNQEIPRFQVLISLVNGYGLSNPTNPDPIVQTFSDRTQIPDYAVQPVAAATQSGLVVNYPERTQLEPNRPVTRAEVAAIVYQALVATEQAEPIESPYVVKP
ncbi:S-layer homology domain-containing protein [Oscillatoria sp. FACHB-1407]|uniref:S-layer homology domain-containing protein n=1 Tax=Oscillatoria sp. FACHB-1407 TaxID=2692847 RepID=UPI00168574E3|nr:S-layer homology domain-containing protein [Oscillatoria sp. FACHB-1407]MBD2460788.1 S-layer homology domain-containing protein [Oscillatoria sp. FACHB-1407]